MLKVTELYQTYNSGKGIKDISFELKKGEILGIVGLNGAGKSTLISCLIGFLKYKSGQIEYDFNGEKYNKISPNLLDKIGIVTSDYGYPEHFTAKHVSNIMSSTYKNWDKNRFFEILEFLELDKSLKTDKYSTGMKTKLAIAIALSHHAKLLILDEATRGLDIKASKVVRELLYDYVASGDNSIILTSHILGEVERMSDSIMFIENGSVHFHKDKSEVIYENQIFEISKDDLGKINKNDLVKFKRTDLSIFAIVKNPKMFSEKYNSKSIDSSLNTAIEILLEGECF